MRFVSMTGTSEKSCLVDCGNDVVIKADFRCVEAFVQFGLDAAVLRPAASLRSTQLCIVTSRPKAAVESVSFMLRRGASNRTFAAVLQLWGPRIHTSRT
jgi:hypothetical protein